MKLRLTALTLSLLFLAGCSGTYICETEFGQDPPLVNQSGNIYWPSVCVPEDEYLG